MNDSQIFAEINRNLNFQPRMVLCADSEQPQQPFTGTLIDSLIKTVAKVAPRPVDMIDIEMSLYPGRDFEYDHDSEEL